MTIKTKGRGKDKRKRKSRSHKSTDVSDVSDVSETPKKNILSDIIDIVSSKVKCEKEEPWSLDVEPVRVPMLGRHVFKKKEKTVEINLGKL